MLFRNMNAVLSHSFSMLVCLTTGPKPLLKRAPHLLRSRASPSKWEYPLLSLRSSSSLLRLLPRLRVTSVPPFIFPSITRCRRKFLRKMWPIWVLWSIITVWSKSCWMFVVRIGTTVLMHIKPSGCSVYGEYSPHILSKRSIYGCHVIVTLRSDYWVERHWLIRLTNWETVCFLWDKTWMN